MAVEAGAHNTCSSCILFFESQTWLLWWRCAGQVCERMGPGVVMVGSLVISAGAVLACGFVLDNVVAFTIFWSVVSFLRTTYSGAHGGYIGTTVPERFRTTVTGVGT